MGGLFTATHIPFASDPDKWAFGFLEGGGRGGGRVRDTSPRSDRTLARTEAVSPLGKSIIAVRAFAALCVETIKGRLDVRD